MSETSTHRATVASALAYKDPEAAIDWLSKAFGFDITMVIRDDSGAIIHSELGLGNGYLMVGGEWREHIKAPGNIGGAATQRISVHLDGGVDAHFERARAAGAQILVEPRDEPYGARVYVCVDPEGHKWDFSEPVRGFDPNDMERAGMKVEQLGDEPHIGTFFPQAFYQDPRAAVDWLSKAFGFDPTMIIESEDGSIRAHLALQDQELAIGSESEQDGPPHRSPRSVGGANTQTIHVQLTEDIDAHCERARAAGGVIDQEPETQFYGDRTYRAFDPEGHMWTFAQTIELKTNEEMEAALPGIKISDAL